MRLSKYLGKLVGLKRLTLSNNKFEVDGTELIAPSLKALSRLEFLDMVSGESEIAMLYLLLLLLLLLLLKCFGGIYLSLKRFVQNNKMEMKA